MSNDRAITTRDRRRGTIYPSPFFDIAQTYMPPTVKELFRWCQYFFYKDPMIGAVVTKIAEYPITNFVYNATAKHVRDSWRVLLEDELNLKPFLIEIGLDYFAFGNAFVSINLPFIRWIQCKECGTMHRLDDEEFQYKFQAFSFVFACKSCGHHGIGKIVDKPVRDRTGINFVRWNPQNIDIHYNPITGKSRYRYKIPNRIKKSIMQGTREILTDIPAVFLEALKKRRDIALSEQNLFHFKRPTLAEQDMGWGKPLIIHSMARMFYLYVLRRAQEAIALQRILPLEFIFPQANAQQDPYQHVNLSNWQGVVQTEIRKWRVDPNYISVVSVPLGFERLGGDGRALLLGPEIEVTNKEISGGMGVPLEFVFGGLCVQNTSLIPTDQGIVEIKSLAPSDPGRSRTTETTIANHEGPATAVLAHSVGDKPAVRMRTRNGYELVAAPTHPVLVLRPDLTLDFEKVEDLSVGSFVVRKTGANLWAHGQAELPAVKRRWGSRTDHDYPRWMTRELARLLGYLVSEGCIDRERFRFGNTDQEVVDDYLACLSSVFGITPSIRSETLSSGKTMYHIEVYAVDTAAWLREIGFSGKSHDKVIPWSILQSSKEYVSEFMKAYYEGDGTVSVKPSGAACVAYTVSKELAQQLQLVLQNAGIESSIYRPTKASATYKVSVRQNLGAFQEFAGFTGERKRAVLAAAVLDRPEEVRVPYVKEAIKAVRKNAPQIYWSKEPFEPELEERDYSVDEARKILSADKMVVLNAIADGELRAEHSTGQGRGWLISHKALGDYCRTVGKTVRGGGEWPRLYKRHVSVHSLRQQDMSLVVEHDPELAKRIARIVEGDLRFDEVVEIEELDDLVPMSDLSVPGPECYIASGIVCHNSWSGSSVSLRTLENHFLMYRRLLLRFVNWAKNRLRLYLGLPDVQIGFTEFKMADDIQRKQIVIQLNAANKISDHTMLTELGFDYDDEQDLIEKESEARNRIQALAMRAQTEAQGEAQIIQARYQVRAQEAFQEASGQQLGAVPPEEGGAPQDPQAPMQGQPPMQQQPPAGQMPQPAPGGQVPDASSLAQDQQMAQQATQEQAAQQPAPVEGQPGAQAAAPAGAGGQVLEMSASRVAKSWANRLAKMDPTQQQQILGELRQKMPNMARLVEQLLGQMGPGGTAGEAADKMKPLPQAAPPRRQGGPI